MTDTQKPSFVTYEEFKLTTDSQSAQLKELVRKFDEIKKIVELTYKDRGLQLDTFEAIGGLRNALIAYDKHNEELSKETNQAVVKTQDIVENKVSEGTDKIKETTDKIHDKLQNKVIKVKNTGYFGFLRRMKKGK